MSGNTGKIQSLIQQISKIKLRTLLLGVFLLTILASTAAITLFTYSQYKKSIRHLSQSLINIAGKSIISQINCLIEQFERLPKFGEHILLQHNVPLPQNQEFISFILEETKDNPLLMAYYAGTPNGDYVVALDLTLSSALANAIAPPGTFYALLLSDEGNLEKRIFYDSDLHIKSTSTMPRSMNVLTRPWYLGAEKTKKLYWTDTYFYAKPQNQGISAAIPIYNQQNLLSAVIGADLPLDIFSQFIEKQSISPNGFALILDEKGNILLPENKKEKQTENLAQAVFQTFQQTQEADITFDFSKKTYLASIHPLKESFNNKWVVAVIAPRADFFAEILKSQRLALLFSLVIVGATSCAIIYLSYRISKPISALSQEIDKIAQLDLSSEPQVLSPILEIDRIDNSINSMRTALRSFARYIPHEIAKRLMHTTHAITLGGEKKNITIFFTDIANFTSIAEGLPIETVNALLAAHFDLLSKVILQCGGLIDKYIGDSIMSLWGAIDETSNRSIQACKAALLCQARLLELNTQQKKQGMPEFITRMGIHSGPVILGNFGTEDRMNYSAIGDTVNTAARLQTLNKNYGTKILISEQVALEIGNQFLTRPLQTVEVRGKKNKIKIFELVAEWSGSSDTAPNSQQIDLSKSFTDAYEAYEAGNLELAKQKFLAIQAKFPDDIPTQLLLGLL